MKSKMLDLVVGGSGVALTEIAQNIQPISADEIGVVGNLIIQIAIAIVTIFGLFKKKK